MPTNNETLQTGRRGELLVQSRLLSYGIDSAPMTTDCGVDLVALRSDKGGVQPVTIQVKTTKGLWPPKTRSAYCWTFPEESLVNNSAEVVAFVAVDKIPERIWMFNYAELRREIKRGTFQIHLKAKRKGTWTVDNCKPHLLDENVANRLFPSPRGQR